MATTISQTDSQREFYRGWLMGRAAFDPKEFGVEMDRVAFIDAMADAFNDTYHGMWTIDDLCCRPDVDDRRSVLPAR